MYKLKKILSIMTMLVITINTLSFTVSGNAETADDRWDLQAHTSTNISATDALGRKLIKVSDIKDNRYVGMFYFAWHNSDYGKVYDVTKILRDNPNDLWSMDPGNTVSPRATHYFNEPLYGYYNSADPYVIRKHIELFIAAEIDFIAYDFTNSKIYWQPLNTMLDLLNEYYEAGWKVPQVMFFTKRNCQLLIPELYEKLYSINKYPHLWFKGSGDKPYLIATKSDVPENLHNFFEFRHPFWPSDEFREDGWPYVDFVRPQRHFGNLMSVSVAQHRGGAFSWSLKGPNNKKRESWGRGYTTTNPINGNTDDIESGANFQDQWDYAISEDPEMIFVTGWNEWIAGKFINEEPSYGGVPYWVDSFNTEFSRDAEMTKSRNYVKDENGKYIEEGYGDNFYLQIINNVRKYKAISATENTFKEPVSKTIDIKGTPTQWNEVSNVYLNMATDRIERNFSGFSPRTRYKQAKPENIINEIRLTHDKSNFYFYIEAKDNITAYTPGKTNWLNLFIGIENSNIPSWENYHYVINRKPNQSTTSLERFTGNGYATEKISDVEYSVQGKVLQIKIPRKDLNLENENFSIYFKASDSIEKEDDIMDYYVSGESVPMGRLSFTYESKFTKPIDNTPINTKAPNNDNPVNTKAPNNDITPDNTNAPNNNTSNILNWVLLIGGTIAAGTCIILLLGGSKKK